MAMSGFLANNKEYEIRANNQIAALLAQFDSGYVMDTIEDTLNQLFIQFDMIPRPNIVQSFETIFKEMYNIYPTDLDNINQCRIETYHTIIDYICKKYDIRFIQPENIDSYSLAFFMYDFFIARLNIYMVQFYVRYIIDEKENIIQMLDMESIKKSKDANFNYNKIAFGNNEILAAIASNLPIVLQKISTLPILDHQIYMYIYGQQPFIVQMLEESISPNVSIFSRYNSLLFNESLYGPILTNIRVQFQQTLSTIDMNAKKAANM